MADNVINFPGTDNPQTDDVVFEDIFEPQVQVSDVLDNAASADLRRVIVIGHTEGGDLYFSSSSGSAADLILDLEQIKHIILSNIL